MSTLTENPRENLVATPCQPITTHASPKDQTHYQSPEDNTTIADSEAKIPLPDLEKIESRVIRASQAHQLVKRYALNSLATGFIPLPLIDMAALFGIQLKMLYDLAKQYEVPFSHNMANALVGAVLGGFIPTATVTTPISASLSKGLPLFGQISGIIGIAATGGASTYAVGKIFIEHFESGGTFLNFNPDKMRQHFRELYEEGMQLVAKPQPQQ